MGWGFSTLQSWSLGGLVLHAHPRGRGGHHSWIHAIVHIVDSRIESVDAAGLPIHSLSECLQCGLIRPCEQATPVAGRVVDEEPVLVVILLVVNPDGFVITSASHADESTDAATHLPWRLRNNGRKGQ